MWPIKPLHFVQEIWKGKCIVRLACFIPGVISPPPHRLSIHKSINISFNGSIFPSISQSISSIHQSTHPSPPSQQTVTSHASFTPCSQTPYAHQKLPSPRLTSFHHPSISNPSSFRFSISISRAPLKNPPSSSNIQLHSVEHHQCLKLNKFLSFSPLHFPHLNT